jgi:hypothetical protein
MSEEKLDQKQLDNLPVKFRYFNKEEKAKIEDSKESESEVKYDRHPRFSKSDPYNTSKLLCFSLFRPTSKL